MIAPVVILDDRRVGIVRLQIVRRVRLQERLFVRGREPEHGQHLVTAARAIDQPTLRVGGGQRAQRIGARDVQRQQLAVIFDGGVFVAGAILVQRHQRLARAELLGIERDHLLERLDGGDGRLLCARSSAWRCHRPARRRRDAWSEAGGSSPSSARAQLVRQPEALGQSIAEATQRDQRGFVLRIFDQRLLQQRRRLAHVAPFRHQQRGVAPPLAALLGILYQVDEQRGGLARRPRSRPSSAAASGPSRAARPVPHRGRCRP